MSTHQENFRAWYVEVLQALYPKRDAGIAALMISLPILERYIRQKNGVLPEQSLSDGCMATLLTIFPALTDKATARDFWQVYRNGFLHQATLSLKTSKGRTLPAGSLTHDIVVPVLVEPDGSFVIQPVLFSQHVIQSIESDFATFAGVGAAPPPLPRVVGIVDSASGVNVPPVALSTRS
jgi:hypothetical protein